VALSFFGTLRIADDIDRVDGSAKIFLAPLRDDLDLPGIEIFYITAM